MPVQSLPLPRWRLRAGWPGLLAFTLLGPGDPGLGPAGIARAQAGPQPIPMVQAAPLAPPAAPAAPASPEQFTQVLEKGSLDQLVLACREALQFDQLERLRLLRGRLLSLYPEPQPLPVVLANADALVSCQAPAAALAVLDRYGPAPGPERQQWLLLQWRAAAAGLDHRRAVGALGRLVHLEGAELEQIALPVGRQDDGTVISRPALDLLIEHWVALGRPAEASRLASGSRATGEVQARRLQQAAALQPELPLAERNRMLETALEQAAAAGAWGLVAELLDAQVALHQGAGGDPRQAIERRLRLSPAMDDAYGEWVLRRQQPQTAGDDQQRRTRALESQLRSPRSPGGHADPSRPASAPAP